MSLINVSVKHGRPFPEARSHLEATVHDVCTRFGAMVTRVEWNPQRDQVKMFGPGVEVELRVDAEHVHISGDMPVFGKLLGSPLLNKIKGIVQDKFQNRLSKPEATK